MSGQIGYASVEATSSAVGALAAGALAAEYADANRAAQAQAQGEDAATRALLGHPAQAQAQARAEDAATQGLLGPPPLPAPAAAPQGPPDASLGGPSIGKPNPVESIAAAQPGPTYRLTVHGIDGSLRTASSVSPLVRVHVVDIDTGNWRWKVLGESTRAVYNIDANGAPYFRMTPTRREPWQADIGQSPYIRPFSTMPCSLEADRSGVVRAAPVWEEQFLITEPLAQSTLLLFEVLSYVEERPAGPGIGDVGHGAHCVGLAWGFLDIDRVFALNLSRGSQRRLRLQLHMYRKSRLNMGWFGRRQRDYLDALEDMADDNLGLTPKEDALNSSARPAVYNELRRPAPARSSSEDDKPGLVRQALRSMAEWFFSRRRPWPAVLEISLEQVQPKGDLDKVAEALNKELSMRRAHAGGQTPVPQELGPVTAPTDTVQTPAVDLSQPEQSSLAPHNTRHRDQPCDLPDDVLWQIPTGERGASRLSVSPSGHLLAVAVSRRSGAAELRIFRVLSGRVHAVCTGAHDAMVYDLCWHSFTQQRLAARRNTSLQLLISCSGDGVVQLYEVPEDLRVVDETGMPMPTTPLLLRPHATLYLPSHVYSVRPHPSLSADAAQIVLACGGHGFGLMICKVTRERIPEGPEAGRWRAITPHWQERVRLENEGNRQPAPQQADVLCVRFSTQPTSPDNLYVTDAAGKVSLFQVRFDALEGAGGNMRAVFVRHYTSPELAGVPIYAMDVVTSQLTQSKRLSRMRLSNADDWVLVYSRDHMIRLASLHRGMLCVEQKYTGHEAGNYPVRGTMSPDGCHVACGSETGELFLWNAADGKPVSPSTFPEVQLAGPVMDTVWSDHHHMVACCALDDEAPPVLVFIGGDPSRVPPKEPPRPPEPPPLQPIRPPLPLDDMARDLREQFALVPKSIAPAVGSNEWAARWLNSNDNPRSAVSFDEKRQLKEKILGQLLDKKGAAEREQLFAAVHGVPGGIV